MALNKIAIAAKAAHSALRATKDSQIFLMLSIKAAVYCQQGNKTVRMKRKKLMGKKKRILIQQSAKNNPSEPSVSKKYCFIAAFKKTLQLFKPHTS